ncbi:MAG: diadenylate cyclase CdaA [Eubacterium sp.]|nr:diadenylate cyclase CdaA [Eubacterium sp.]
MYGIWYQIKQYFDWFYIPKIGWQDILDILIIAYIIYHILSWIKSSRAWTLLRGIIFIACFAGVAAIFKLNTLLWLTKNFINVGIIAVIILFQPEFRHALDELGRKRILKNIFTFEDKNAKELRLSDKTIYELVKTSVELSKDKTGALIVLEHDTPLGEYEQTGISIDAVVTEQLLINIFEKNTPLHDGAVIIRNNRVVAATCYLPLTDRSDVNKKLGTRHRAGLGISEVSDSLTIIISEETGSISIAYMGALYRNLDEDGLRRHLQELQEHNPDSRILKKHKNEDTKSLKSHRKGGVKNEKQ